jgi:hypothetical protein
MTSVAKVTRHGAPVSSKTMSPGPSAPIVVQPAGVAIGVPIASALPT